MYYLINCYTNCTIYDVPVRIGGIEKCVLYEEENSSQNTAKHKKREDHDFPQSSLPVEVAGIEPASKHILQKLSTCLFPY